MESLYVDHIHMYNMALREIEPLVEGDFTTLVNDINKGQTKEQEEEITKALHVKKVPTIPL